MDLPDLKLKQDVITRWNSTYEMLERVMTLKDAVISTLSLTRPDLLLPLEQWDSIKEIIPILKPFYEVTIEVSAEKNVTLSKVTVLCNLSVGFISKCHSDNAKVFGMIGIIKSELNIRFGDYGSNVLYAMCTYVYNKFLPFIIFFLFMFNV